MDGNNLCLAVAEYMQLQFKHKLTLATKHSEISPEPKPHKNISRTLSLACQGAVDMIITALLNIG